MILILQITNLTIKTLRGQDLLKNFSFVLNQGDKIALIGEEGNGKSTLLKLIYDHRLVDDYVTYRGVINTGGQVIGYLPQYLPDSWNTFGAADFLLLSDPHAGIEPEAYNELADFYRLANQVNLQVRILDTNQPVKTLSGGERVKLQLIKLLHQRPDLLLLDEPTNDLDLHTLQWLEQFLIKIELPILFISHDETLLKRVANGIVHLEQLKKKSEPQYTVVHIGYQEYLQRRWDLLERDTMIAHKEKAERDEQLERWRRIYQRVDHQQTTVSRQDPHQAKMLKRKMHAIKSMKRRIDKLEVNHAPDPEEAINIYFAAVDLPEDRLVLNLDLPQLAINGQLLSQQLRLIVRGPRHIVIVGDNGTGKTTLLKTIYTQLQDSSLSIAYMAQDYEEIMDAALNPLEYLEVVGQRAEEIKLRQFLGNLKFTVTEMEQPIANLSGGQKAKLALLKLVYQNPQVLLLDEPSRNLSPLSNPVIRQMLSDYQGCIIAISHDRMFIRQLADEVYELTANGLSRLYNWAD